MQYLRWWANLLDSRFTIPGTRIRFGIDPLLSLVPGIGDVATPAFTVLLLVQGVRQGVPKVVLMRMLGNALIDALVGVVPIAGDVGDLFWRANQKNMGLLERHRHPAVRPTRGDYVFVWVAAVILGLMVAVPVAIGIWLGVWLSRHLV